MGRMRSEEGGATSYLWGRMRSEEAGATSYLAKG